MRGKFLYNNISGGATLIAHKFQLGLLGHMKSHTKQLQYLSRQRINFKLNRGPELDENYGNDKCFKKGCVKIQYGTLINTN